MYGWALSQKLLTTDFKWTEETFHLNQDFSKILIEDSDIGYFIETDILCSKNLHELYNDPTS